MPEENRTGPTILWRELEGKKVKSNDGKKLGPIKRISQNHFLIEEGLVRKRGFWVPKIIGDAYDGENIWLSSNEDEIHDKFYYGEEPLEDNKVAPIERKKVVKERMVGIATEPKN